MTRDWIWIGGAETSTWAIEPAVLHYNMRFAYGVDSKVTVKDTFGEYNLGPLIDICAPRAAPGIDTHAICRKN
jgi:hypothetical protein